MQIEEQAHDLEPRTNAASVHAELIARGDIPQVLQDIVGRLAAEEEARRAVVPVSEAHHLKHIAMARADVPAIDAMPAPVQDAIGAVIEIGDEALQDFSDGPTMGGVNQADEAEQNERRANAAQDWVNEHGSGGYADFSELPADIADHVVERYLSGIGSTNSLENIAKQLGHMPPLSEATIQHAITTASSRQVVSKFLLQYGVKESYKAEATKAYEHPDSTMTLLQTKPELAKYMVETHGKTTRVGKLLEEYDNLENEELRASLAHNVEVIMDPKAEDWAKNVAYAMIRLDTTEGPGAVVAGAISWDSAFKPHDNLISVPLPLSSTLPNVAPTAENLAAARPFSEMTVDERRMVANEAFLAKHVDDIATVGAISLADVHPAFQEQILAYTLRQAIHASKDLQKQQEASQSNASMSAEHPILVKNDLIHTAHIANIDQILDNGLVCGELIGVSSVNDAYPFNVDFNRVEGQDTDKDFAESMKRASVNWHNGETEGTITYIMRRHNEADPSSYTDRPANVSLPGHKHRLVFGAVAATEIGMIVLNTAAEDLQTDTSTQIKALEAVLSRDVYYPVVSGDGKILLSYDDFLHKRSARLDDLRAVQTQRPAPVVNEIADKPPVRQNIIIPDFDSI